MLPEKNTAQVKTVLIFLTAAKYTKRKKKRKREWIYIFTGTKHDQLAYYSLYE